MQPHQHGNEAAFQLSQDLQKELQVKRENQQKQQEQDQKIQYLELNNNHLTTQNQQLLVQVQQQDRQLQELRAEKLQSQQQIQGLRQQNQSLDRQLQEKQQNDQLLQQQIQELRQQNQSLDRELQEKQQNEQLLQQQIQELRQQNEHYRTQNQTPTWVVNRREINLSEKELGRGAYGWVKEATFRGCKVAVKCLHNEIISDYNLHVFDREMTMAARCRHPNLLQFIGATNEGVPLIVTEIMHSSLRKKLERGEVSSEHIINISIGVACGLNYLHKTVPWPILHRDVSSANVLLNPLPSNQWLAKLSDFGSFNFMRESQTVNAGNPAYAAPEALDPSKGAHSPAMDVFSFGVLLHEMCSRRQPTGGLNPAVVRLVNWKLPESSLVTLIVSSVEESILKRPSMDHLLFQLNHLQ